MAGDLVRILEQAKQNVPEFLLLAKTSDPSAATENRTGSKFGGRDIRRNTVQQNAQPVSHEPEENW